MLTFKDFTIIASLLQSGNNFNFSTNTFQQDFPSYSQQLTI